MSHVTTKRILQDARNKRYGIPCFLAGNMEMIVGQITAAERCNSPLILAYNQWITRKIPMDLIVPFMVRAAEKASVPVATILDHGSDMDTVEKTIALGLSSVMFDASGYEYKENVRYSKEVVQLCRKCGVAVEAELGAVGGSALEKGGTAAHASNFTDPEQVVDFIKTTGIDQLAVSIGNVHGTYSGEPKIDYELLKKISAVSDVPLVLHGGSGLTEADYKKLIEYGISKINYYSVMGKTAANELKTTVNGSCPNAVFHEIIDWSTDFFEEFSAYIFDLFGSCGKAQMIPGTEINKEQLDIEKITQIAFESYKELRGR